MSDSPHLDEALEAGFADSPMRGIFLMRGQSVDLPEITITAHEDGSITTSEVVLSLATHMSPYWLEAAMVHARNAERLSHLTNEAFHGSDTDLQIKALEAEALASMQAITCSAFAVEALYASVLKVQPTPEATLSAWRRNRTKRSRQIFETLRRAFKMGPQSANQLRTFLDQVSEARDRAVHPPSKSKPATKHTRLPVGVDPTFNIFRARNAIASVGMTFLLIESTAKAETVKDEKVATRMAALKELVDPVAKRWWRTKAGRIYRALVAAKEGMP